MINFRQKQYAAPALLSAGNLLTAGMVGQGFMQMNQASKQAKEVEEQQQQALRQQKRENDKLVKALNNIAKNAPDASAQAGHLVGQSKLFAAPAGIMQKTGQVVSDFVKAAGGTGKIGKKVLTLGSAGLATGAAMYTADKLISRDARNIGMMPKKGEIQQRSYTAPSVMSKIGVYAKKAGKYLSSKENLKTAGGWAALGAAFPVGGYLLGDRQQFKNQQAQQELQQRSYSIANSIGRWFKTSTATQIFRTPKRTITGGIARFGSLGMIGHETVGKFANNLKNNSKSEFAKKIGAWAIKNPGKANVAVGLAGGSVLTSAYGAGEKAFKKTANALDKDSYTYENFKNQQIPQQ